MYLKRLEIQGYKSFANRTEFTFDGGITAIVGPNGSGKSNIADAVRWALGEQSYSALRAKRTEDLIFTGSAQRARVGLAEVSLVFDNGTHWLPLDYSEVTIMRRAYRSGENEYHLNGNRVRLRDITELLTRAGLGRNASAVIGQGQVDAALSLRPDERRSLLEETAGVRIYIDKRDEALARLEETRHNLERLNDIVVEITPRMQTLQRQAERTQEYDGARRELEAALLEWYGYQWQRHEDRIAQLQERVAEQARAVDAQNDLTRGLAAQREELRIRQQDLRDDSRRRREQADQLREQYEEQRRRLAVTQERRQALVRQAEQTRADVAAAEARRADLGGGIQRQEQELGALAASIAEQEAAASAAHATLATAETELRAQRDDLERARALAFETATAQAASRNRLAQLQRRQGDLESELAEQRSALDEADKRAQSSAIELAAAEDERQQLLTKLSQSEEELRQAEEELALSMTRLDELRAQRDHAREQHQRLGTQYDVLQRARGQASHLYEGAQAVIRENMPGVLGTVASLVQVPGELEVAMEAALGGHLQDIVVKTWNDALACIELLKRRERGRATFLPLDYVRPPQPIPAPRIPGVRGVAARLIKADAAYSGICELLLGNIVIVEDLPAGRKALGAESRLRRAVTLDGDVVETRGVVRGGSRPRARGFLSQEREWRELPERVAAAQEALDKAEAQVREEDERQQACRRRAREHAQRQQASRSALSQQDQRTNTLRQRHDRLAQEVTWRRTLAAQAGRSLDVLQADRAQVEGELASIEETSAQASQHLETLRAAAEREDLPDLRRRAAECDTALAVASRSKQAKEEMLAAQRETLARAEADAAARRAQLERLEQEASDLQREADGLHVALSDMEGSQAALAAPLAAAEADLLAIERRQTTLEAEEERARQQLQVQQSELHRLTLQQEQVQGEAEELKRQMEAELGPVEPPDSGQPRQLRLNLGDGVTPLPQVTQLPPGLATELRDLRARLRKLGPVNPSAPAEYDEVRERHRFLTEQVRDLNSAAEATDEIVAELNRLIRERFGEAFARVASEFSGCFSTLFNGGSARLPLTDPDNPAEAGVEIVARPPGKRSQSLALLSGGERALTATALLFALLKVNPLPFCVLDEVDAMLDEANVHRFRTFLESLARETQFIVITHNRHTVEAAATVYGVSMAREGVSQVLSLSLPDAEAEGAGGSVPAA